jgi:hypothetical protein
MKVDVSFSTEDIMGSIILLDPHNPDSTIEQLEHVYKLPADVLALLRRVLAILPSSARMYMDEANAVLVKNLALIDKFTFDLEADELIIYSLDAETLIDALIEMAMYLSGFATMIGTEEIWVTEFAAGAWKPVRKQIKRNLDLPVDEHPRAVVGLPSSQEKEQEQGFSFREIVTHYDVDSFHQMITLAARDDVAVYFPPDTHSKVLATYVYARRAMQDVAKGLGIGDHQEFNGRLIEAVQRIQSLFNPQDLPSSVYNIAKAAQKEDPFEAFIEELFADDDNAGSLPD